jgi:hypothetical protein
MNCSWKLMIGWHRACFLGLKTTHHYWIALYLQFWLPMEAKRYSGYGYLAVEWNSSSDDSAWIAITH